VKSKYKLIGYCAVDSGLIIISDPCYVLPIKEDNNKGYDYNKLCSEVDLEKLPKEHLFSGVGGTGIITGVSIDGQYPVYADIDNDGFVKEIKIKFI